MDIIKKLKDIFTNKLYKYLKIHFSDVCSNGDIIINKILDKLINNSNSFTKDELKYTSYIWDVYNEYYLKNKESDPFWAD